jgi:hypothetical protein
MRTARVRAARRHNGGERLINDSMNFETSQLTIKNPRTFDGGENFFGLNGRGHDSGEKLSIKKPFVRELLSFRR